MSGGIAQIAISKLPIRQITEIYPEHKGDIDF